LENMKRGQSNRSRKSKQKGDSIEDVAPVNE